MRLEKRQKSKRREVSRSAANKAINPVAFIFVFFSAKTARPVLADGHDGIETECDVCHVNYYHKVCVLFSLT